METEDGVLDKQISYETKMMLIFRELQLKPNQRELVRAFIIIANGKTEFEASFSELEALTTKREKSKSKTANIRYALRTLLSWQDENQIELIRILKKGERLETPEGKFIYEKTKYKFILLGDLATVINTDSERLETVFNELKEKIRAEYKPSPKLRKYGQNHKLRSAKRTIETKLKVVFDLSQKAGLNAIYECKKVLRNVESIVQLLEKQETKRVNRERFIKEFESSLGLNEMAVQTEAVSE